jgi:predicted RNA-binding Zn-ribbon protein involved in translation (DUF1610 family)
MPTTRPAITAEQARKKCLACGFDGRALQGERGRLTFECPSCGADLYARPPRSYAELEGLVEADSFHDHLAPTPRAILTRSRPLHRRPPSARRAGVALERLLAVSIGVVFVVASVAGALAVVG